MTKKQDALNAVQKTDYVLAFQILEEAGVMNTDLEFLKKSLIKGRIDADFEERLQLAIENAFRDASAAPKIPHALLPIPSPPVQFVGRRQDLDALHANLQAEKRTLLLNGVGGVGKTTLAQKYAQEQQTEYAHILWIRQSGDLFSSFVQEELFENLQLVFKEQETGLNAFLSVLRELKKLQGKNLLIVDNYEQTDGDKMHDTVGKLIALPAQWRIVCTSRASVPIFDETLPLDVLPADEAIELFKRHAGKKPVDDAEVRKLLDMVGFHTLMTELWAKIYKQCTQFARVGEMHEHLRKEGLKNPYLDKTIHIGTQKIAFYKHLCAVFSLTRLSDDERWLLKQWAVLPTAAYKAKDFLTWIQDNALAYESTLLSLTEKGWLQTADDLAYSLHPLLQLFFLAELKPTLIDCVKMWEFLTDLAYSDAAKAHPLAHQHLIPLIEALIENIDFTGHEYKQAKLWEGAYFLYRLLGDYHNAIRCTKECLIIEKATVGERHEEYAGTLSNLAFLYESMDNYAAALPLHQESIQIMKEVLGKRHPDYAASLNNLALLYNKQGEYAAALPLFQESLQIRKKVLGEQHPDYATSLNNLALLYDNQGDYATALPLYQEAMRIWKEVLGERHPDYAVSLHNLGMLYFEQEDYTQARRYMEEAYSICVERLGEQHPYTKNTKSWLDDLP